jgi:starch phosphorylase
MSRTTRPIQGVEPPSSSLEGFDRLAELALDLRRSWQHPANNPWRQLDPALWDLTENPWVVLQTVSRERLQQVLADPAFRESVEIIGQGHADAPHPAWFDQRHSNLGLSAVAYFSMEFMLSEALPIYSGGLGNVAGDQLKAASDLGVPLVGVGLLYQQGYFRQVIDRQGAQQELFPYNEPGQLPITPLREANGEWLRLEIRMPGHSVWLRAWQAQVGRLKLYLLDSNDAANFPAYRGITSELYGGGPDLRLKQELLLGMGGWRLLGALGIRPDVCHLNEGHAAFVVLERARSFMETAQQPFEVALAATRAGNLFTTHTPVTAGFDRFSPALIEQHLSGYAADRLGITTHDLLALGRRNPNDPDEPFNMAYLAVRGSGAINGVSRLHGQVSRHLFLDLFPKWPEADIPITHVTNGVDVPTWESANAADLWSGACGTDRWLGTTEIAGENIRRIADAQLWAMRAAARRSLVQHARERLSRQLAAAGAPADAIDRATHLFDPDVLTLGFARRFAEYKRPHLLLHDRDRLVRILTNAQRPVQLFIAGKAHPEDQAGRAMIQQWVQFIWQPEVRPHAVFLADYDLQLTQHLVHGVDVWLNTPRRPWEASGTSGMKVLVNGGLNLSELDGWWAEAYAPEVGWALGDGQEHGDDPAWDAAEAEALYDLLEQQVIPEFYTRNALGIPTAWVARMRESMARLTPRFSAKRTVCEYTEQHYLPAAAAHRARTANGGALAAQVVAWRRTLDQHWSLLRFGEAKVQIDERQQVFEIQLYLDDLPPDSLGVELFADGVDGAGPVRHEMARIDRLEGSANGYLYRASVPASRPATDYTARVVPQLPGANVPLEASHILWQRDPWQALSSTPPAAGSDVRGQAAG